MYVIEVGARMGGDFIGSHLVQLSTGYDFVKGVIDVALNQFEEPNIDVMNYSGVYFLCEETKVLLPYFENKTDFEVQKKILDNKLKKTVAAYREKHPSLMLDPQFQELIKKKLSDN